MFEDKYTTGQLLAMLKVIHCLSFDDFIVMVGEDNPGATLVPGTYWTDAFQHMKKDLFGWICTLSRDEQKKCYIFAEKKAMWQKLNKESKL